MLGGPCSQHVTGNTSRQNQPQRAIIRNTNVFIISYNFRISIGRRSENPTLSKTYRIMHELKWITIFGSRVRRFANDFHEWRSREWKSLANRFTSCPKIVIRGNECIILFLTHYLMSWNTQFCLNNYRALISPLSLRTVFSDLVLWRHHSWSVTSRECRTLALWRHIRRLFSHAQIGAKAIFTSE